MKYEFDRFDEKVTREFSTDHLECLSHCESMLTRKLGVVWVLMGIILVCVEKGIWVRFYPSSITAAFLTQLSLFNNMWEVHNNRRFIKDGLTISFIIPIQKSGPSPDVQTKPHWQVVWIIKFNLLCLNKITDDETAILVW